MVYKSEKCRDPENVSHGPVLAVMVGLVGESDEPTSECGVVLGECSSRSPIRRVRGLSAWS